MVKKNPKVLVICTILTSYVAQRMHRLSLVTDLHKLKT